MIRLMNFTMFALAATAVFACGPAAAADSFLKFGAVTSGSTGGKVREAAARAGAGQQVEVVSWSWGVSQPAWNRSAKGSTAVASGD
jgi:hypothetical protein